MDVIEREPNPDAKPGENRDWLVEPNKMIDICDTKEKTMTLAGGGPFVGHERHPLRYENNRLECSEILEYSRRYA